MVKVTLKVDPLPAALEALRGLRRMRVARVVRATRVLPRAHVLQYERRRACHCGQALPLLRPRLQFRLRWAPGRRGSTSGVRIAPALGLRLQAVLLRAAPVGVAAGVRVAAVEAAPARRRARRLLQFRLRWAPGRRGSTGGGRIATALGLRLQAILLRAAPVRIAAGVRVATVEAALSTRGQKFAAVSGALGGDGASKARRLPWHIRSRRSHKAEQHNPSRHGVGRECNFRRTRESHE